MNDFTSDELKTIHRALNFYQYEMNKTDDMNEYRTWKSTMNKLNVRLEVHRGVWSWKESKQC